MSDLNLIPNPQLMAIQAAFFVSQIVVVKCLFVDPYLKLKKLRDGATTGADSKAEELKNRVASLSREVHVAITKAHEEVRSIKEEGKVNAKKLREADLADAHKKMSELVRTARADVRANLQEERVKVRSFAGRFVEEFYAMIAR